MANALRNDPLPAFNFYVTLLDSSNFAGTIISAAVGRPVAEFSECTGLDAMLEVMQYKEGGQNAYIHRLPTRAHYSDIMLKRGVIYQYDDLWNWHYEWVQGGGTRRDGLITLADEGHTPLKVWKFKRAIPTKWVGPSLDASQSKIAIELLEIAHEGLELEVGA